MDSSEMRTSSWKAMKEPNYSLASVAMTGSLTPQAMEVETILAASVGSGPSAGDDPRATAVRSDHVIKGEGDRAACIGGDRDSSVVGGRVGRAFQSEVGRHG